MSTNILCAHVLSSNLVSWASYKKDLESQPCNGSMCVGVTEGGTIGMSAMNEQRMRPP